jgi:AraC-like DNA-binding protein
VLRAHTLLHEDGLNIADVACRHEHGRGREVEVAAEHRIVFVRRGCFVRAVGGSARLLDPTLAFCTNPGTEQRYDHPHTSGDDCTSFRLAPALLAGLWGGDPDLPAGRPLPVTPELDLAHRTLLAAARRGAPSDSVLEGALELIVGLLAHVDEGRVGSGRPASARQRRALADEARQALAADPGCSQRDLAERLAVSPHHLSRLFRAETGTTLSRHRRRLRVRAALERLHGGERDLARVAAEAGFADQSHLCRAVRSETGCTPAALRAAIGPAGD